MSTIRAQLEAVKVELNLAKKAENAKHTIEEIQEITNKLDSATEMLDEQVCLLDTLRALPDGALQGLDWKTIQKSSLQIRKGLEVVTRRWETEGHNVRQGNDLVTFENNSKKLSERIEMELRHAWTGWVSALAKASALDEPMLESQARIPGQGQLCADFRKIQKTFHDLTSRLPSQRSDIQAITKATQRMVALKGSMSFNTPEDVLDFLKAFDSYPQRRVGLHQLTPEVLAWLNKHGWGGQFSLSRNQERA